MKLRRIARITLVCSVVSLVLLAGSTSQLVQGQGEGPPPPFSLPTSVIPMPVPDWQPAHGIPAPLQVVEYDPQSGVESYLPLTQPTDETHESLPAASPDQAENFGSFALISNPSMFPYSANVKFYAHFPGMAAGTAVLCSGVLIDDMHVLTAGQCIYTWNSAWCSSGLSCWADSVTVVPAYNSGSAPFGNANNGGSLRTYSAWTVNQNYDFDIGLVWLNRPIGVLADHLAVDDPPNATYTGSTFNNPGYPITGSSPCNGEALCNITGVYDTVNANTVYYNRTPYAGFAGAGAYYLGPPINTRYVSAVHSHNLGGASGQTRITAQKLADINNWLATDRPNTADLIPLAVTVAPTAVIEGKPLTQLDFTVVNYSDAAFTGIIYFDVYLSTNTTISAADTLLGGYFVSSSTIAAQDYLQITHQPAAMPNIAYDTGGGTQYIGIIINNVDVPTGNNMTGPQDVAAVTITTCPKPPVPTLSAPTNLSWTSDSTPYLDWSTSGDDYLLWVDNNSDWSSREIDQTVTPSNFTPGAPLAEDNFYWAVKARETSNGCSRYGDWSSVRVVKLDLTNPTSSVASLPAITCGNQFNVSWSGSDARSGVDTYQLQYRVGSGGFVSWFSPSTAGSQVFGPTSPVTTVPGETYYFRSSAVDKVGRSEIYPPGNGDAWTTVYDCVFLPFTGQ